MTRIKFSETRGIRLLKTVIILSIMLFSGYHDAMGRNNKSDVKAPDFAFPETVAKDASENYGRAILENNSTLLLRSLIDYVTAEELITRENTTLCLDRLTAAEAQSADPLCRSLINLMRATVYYRYYLADRWNLDRRELPVSPLPDQLSQWSGQQLRDTIFSLLDEAMSFAPELEKAPIDTFKGIISADRMQRIYYPTLYDFVGNRAVYIYNSFYESHAAQAKAEKIVAALLKSHRKGSAPYIMYLLESQDIADCSTLSELYKEYATSEYSGDILAAIEPNSCSVEEKKILSENLRQYIASRPTYWNINRLKNQLKLLLRQSVGFSSVHGNIAPACPFDIDVTLINANSADIKIYKLTGHDFDQYIQSDRLNGISPTAVFTAKCDSIAPFTHNTKIKATIDKEGTYAIAVTLPGHSPEGQLNIIRCSQISGISVRNSGDTPESIILAVNTTTGAPIAKAGVAFRGSRWSNGKNTHKTIDLGFTNKDGICSGSYDTDGFYYGNIILKSGTHKFISDEFYLNNYNRTYSASRYHSAGYTSLAIYRPGDTVDFSFILWAEKDRQSVLAKDIQARVVIRDANNRSIDTLSATTDSFGRLQGAFRIPENTLTGNFSLMVQIEENPGKFTTCGRTRFTVSDYKAPKFHADIISVRRDFPQKGDVTITGKATTYSGMPVSKADVAISLDECSRLWWGSFNNTVQKLTAISATTDKDGEFEVTFAKDIFKNTTQNYYKATFDVTSTTGETQSCYKYFTTGKPYQISIGMQDAINLRTPVKVNLNILDADNNKVNPLDMTYSLSDVHNEDVVTEGRLNSNDPVIDMTRIPQGIYRLTIQTADTTLSDAQTTEFILYDPTANKIVVNQTLFIPSVNYKFENGKADILFGIGDTEAYIYCFISDSEGNTSHKVLHKKEGYHSITVSPLAPKAENTYVTLLTMRNGKVSSGTIRIENAEASRKISVSVESFRDKLVPGEQESWTLRTVDASGKPVKSALLIDIYNRALDQIKSHNFPNVNFNISPRGGKLYPANLSRENIYDSYTERYKTLTTENIDRPNFSDYGLDFGFNSMRRYKMKNPVRAMFNYKAEESIEEVVVEEESAVLTADAAATEMAAGIQEYAIAEEENSIEDNAPTESGFEYRQAEMPLMMFRPMLTTDDNGCESLTFTVPNATASWRLALVAFTESMQSAQIMKDFITAKPIMVMPNAPRFIRTGDTARIAAAVTNATDSVVSAIVTVEIFNPVTSDVLSSETSVLKLDSRASGQVFANISAPDDIPAIGYRVKAMTGRFSDGEQIVLPVLPSAAPVVESLPFYISPGTADFTVTIPDVPSDATVSLQYCDNTQWTVVSALPGLRKDAGTDANSAAAAIYSACIAQGLAKEYPAVSEAIKAWSANPADSMLVSMLEKNNQLKTTILNATPWVQDAANDTERMARLALLFDKKETDRTFETAKKVLEKLHAANGGWMWFPQAREASMWTTVNVLGMLGELKSLGYLPKDKELDNMIKTSVLWLDNESVKEYNKYRNADAFYKYVFTRSLFSNIPLSLAAQELTSAVVQKTVRDWRKMELGSKPMAAVILYNHGYKSLASEVLKSIRQFSKQTPERGMWFPSFDDQKPWWSMSKNIATALILNAFTEIEPESSDIEKISQWLVMQKEAQNWGNSVATTQVVSALLHSFGSQLAPSASTTFALGGTQLNQSKSEQLTGNFMMSLSAFSPAGKKLTLKRSGDNLTQAFGALNFRYKADPANVKAADCDAVSIRKSLLKRVSSPSGYQWVTADTLAVGDRVKVLLTVTVNRDMEYVVIDDQRAAAFEPVDQLPGYMYSEGIAFYRENGDESTNMFITYMPKGTYQLGYELNVNNAGTFTSGLATIQSQYAPALTAHSAGCLYKIEQ